MFKKSKIWTAVIVLSGFPLVYFTAEILGLLPNTAPAACILFWERLHSQAGEFALLMLVITLSCTPLYVLSGNNKILPYKKIFGLYTFIYTLLHISFFIITHNFLDIFRKMSLIIALIAAVIVILLGLTSNKFSQKLLKQTWKKLHEFAYAAAIAAVLHTALPGKGLWPLYAIVLTIGFILRIPTVEYYFRKRRTNYSIGSAL